MEHQVFFEIDSFFSKKQTSVDWTKEEYISWFTESGRNFEDEKRLVL